MNKGNEIDYAALFGVDVGEEEQEVAEPAEVDEDASEGEEAQEITEPAEEIEDDAGESDGDGSASGERESAERPTQSREERARYAAARREAERERDETVARVRREAQEEAQRVIDAAFADSGMSNPYTGQPIRTKAEYDAYRAQHAEEQKASFKRKSGLSDAEFSRMIESLPEVQAARAAQAKAESDAKAAAAERANAAIAEEVRKIGEMDPSIKSMEDLQASGSWSAVYEKAMKGYSLADAYKLVNFDAIRTRTAEAASRAAVHAAQGKAHMRATQARGSGSVEVPAEIKAEYRALMPDITDAEIARHYNKYKTK